MAEKYTADSKGSCITIISGGQTGIDRAALDVAIEFGIPHGGFCTQDRRAEDGVIPDIYQLQALESLDYKHRTIQNVLDSDVTLILNIGALDGGTKLTAEIAEKNSKPCRPVPLDAKDLDQHITTTRQWIAKTGCRRINVAGPRESKRPGAYEAGKAFLKRVFSKS